MVSNNLYHKQTLAQAMNAAMMNHDL